MDEPIRSGRPGAEGNLQAAVESLHEAVGQRMIGGCLSVFYGEEGAKGGPQQRCELWAPVTGDGVQYSESLDPPLQNGSCAVGGGGRSERYRFRPGGRPVDDCEQVCET